VRDTGLADSKTLARRAIEGGGVHLDGRQILDPEQTLEPGPERLLQHGRRLFVRLVP
jgi:tyrosyl-tRNA synthetase